MPNAKIKKERKNGPLEGGIDYETEFPHTIKKAPSTGKKEKELNEWTDAPLPLW